MRKLFLLIPALVLALVANATKWEIDPTYNPDWSSSSQNLEHTIGSNIGDGDTIVLRHGTYVEPYSISINKPVVIMAAENARPVLQRGSYFGVYANVKFIGIKFDGGATTEYAVYVQNTDTKSIIFENCEFTGFSKDIITGSSSKSNLDSCVINNCYFHDNVRSAVKFETSSSRTDGLLACNLLKVTNSTITNVSALSGALIDNRNNANESGTDSLYVDHVTIYNWTDGSNGAIMAYKSHHVEITNCIIAEPADQAYYATYCYGGVVKNCLSYHLTQSTSRNSHKQSTGLSGNFTADPQFVDADHANYKLADLSPARNAGTDGSNLGDPRWNAPSTIPQTDFASPYSLSGATAAISGKIWRNANNYLYGDGDSNQDYGTAEWWIHATRACAVQVALNMDPDAAASGHIFKVEIFDAEDDKKGEVAESGYSTSVVDGILLPGMIYLPAAGDYRIKLSNSQTYSSAVIKGITLSYAGGAVQNMPGTTTLADAWFSNNGTRADGKITFPSSTIQDGWVKWNVAFANAANYNVIVNVNSGNCKNYTVALVDANDANVVTPLTLSNCTSGTPIALEMGAMEVPAGNYILKVTNATQNSDAALLSVQFTYAGGAAVDLAKDAPASLLPNADVIISDDWTIEEGKISYTESKATVGWAKWNVDCADAANYNVQINITSDNGHLMKVEIFEDEAASPIHTLIETEATHWEEGTLAIDLGNIALEDKTYVFKVTNTQSSSHAKIASIVITYTGGAVINLPGSLPLIDAMRSTNAYVDANGLHFSDAEHKSHVDQEWVKWNIHATAGAYTFSFNVNGSDYGIYKLTILDNSNNVIFTKEKGIQDNGSYTTDAILLDGNYKVQMQNVNNHSQGYLTTLSAAAVENVVVIDELDENMDVITNNTGEHVPAVKRTFNTGVYNSICLPFNVGSNTELTNIFGEGYELLGMTSATLEGGVLTLNFSTPENKIAYGTPYLIKPTKDVVNPVFRSHSISASTSHLTVSGGAADLVGVLYKQDLGTHPENLYLGTDGKLYFSNNAVTIKGFRAYFHVNVPNPQQAIQHARIIAGGQVATEIELVGNENANGIIKTIKDGQLVIIRDGVQYNAFGVKVK